MRVSIATSNAAHSWTGARKSSGRNSSEAVYAFRRVVDIICDHKTRFQRKACSLLDTSGFVYRTTIAAPDQETLSNVF